MEKKLVSNGGFRWILISLTTSIIPILMISKGWIISLAILFIIWFVPFLGNIIQFGVMVWAVVQLFMTSFTLISALFLLSLIVYFVFIISPFFINNLARYIFVIFLNKWHVRMVDSVSVVIYKFVLFY